MRVAIVGNGMAFGPRTLTSRGLGGSETAQLCLGHELSLLGCEVTQFCNLSGVVAGSLIDGVRWETWQKTITGEVPENYDLVIVCRQPDLGVELNARMRVLWIQDFAVDYYPPAKYDREPLLFNEIWAVSEWQRSQWLFVCRSRGMALPPIKVMRNAVSRVAAIESFVRAKDKLLTFVSRPERGLLPLVREGGILDRLPDYKLAVCGYDDVNDGNRDFYEHVWSLCDRHPRVFRLGSLPQPAVRQMILKSAAMVIPTNYAETSCMAAMEAITTLTPVVTMSQRMSPADVTGGGALRETLNGCGIVVPWTSEWNSDEFCETFARAVILACENEAQIRYLTRNMLKRCDLTWDQRAREVLLRFDTYVQEVQS